MPGQSELDPYAILAALDITSAIDVSPVTGGKDTAIWRVMWDGKPYALRVFRAEQAHISAREISAMQTASTAGVCVPSVVRSGIWQERPALLLSWASGQPLAQVLLAQPWRIWQLGTAFGRTQAAIHHISVPANMDATDWIEWAGDEPELKARLYSLPSRQTKLLHLDYHPLNIMANKGQISAVLDWANCRAGDPRADFARTYTILRVEPYGPTGDNLQMALMRRILERVWRIGYWQGGGRLHEMALFYAWASAAMIRDLSKYIGQTNSWLQDSHLKRIRIWGDHWKQKAGIQG